MSIDTPARALSRRHIIQGAAWATPAVLIASAIPARAASGDPEAAECVVSRGSWAFPAGGLFLDGQSGIAVGDWDRTTGWTPIQSAAQPPSNGSITIFYGGIEGPPGLTVDASRGFLSMDDGDNRDSAAGRPDSVFSVTFTIDLAAGKSYTLVQPIYVGDGAGNNLGVQMVDVEFSGVSGVPGFKGYHGDPAISAGGAPAGYDYIQPAGTSVNRVIPAQPLQTALTITYTFTLPYVSGGPRQNADIWIQEPFVANCAV